MCCEGAQPGAVSDEPTGGLAVALEGRKPENHELMSAEANFTVIKVTVQRLEWLHLHTRGHRRAEFNWQSDPTYSNHHDGNPVIRLASLAG